MQQRIYIVLSLFLAISLVSCAGTASTPFLTLTNQIGLPTPTASKIVILNTPTKASSSTKKASTLTRTPTKTSTITTPPLPPTKTPTFSTASLATITPPPAEQCPQVNHAYRAALPEQTGLSNGRYELKLTKPILDELNKGASVTSLRNALGNVTLNGYPESLPPNPIYSKDLTGDGVLEIIFNGYHLAIFTCHNGKYQLVYDLGESFDLFILEPIIQDMNRDRIPEIVVLYHRAINNIHETTVFIYRWNGLEFENLVLDRNVHQLEGKSYIVDGQIETSWKDIDQNGTTELIIRSNPATSTDTEYHGPWRDEEHIFTWNGNTFSHLPVKLDPPVYRFQAVNDGDRAFLSGDYQMAMKFYRQTIDDPHLKGWSIAHYENMQRAIDARWNQESTPTPPPDDPNERANLSAYAHFRIVLAYTVLGESEKAREAYDLMQLNYPGEEPGNAYAHLANAFLKGYQGSKSLEEGCASAIDFAIHHEEEILSPLSIEWHGWQSLNYKYAIRDENSPLCPFVAAK